MTTLPCDATRALLLDGRREEAHLPSCSACADFARSLATTDAALAADAAAALRAVLPSVLRARIVGATRTSRASYPRGRLLEFALRAAAVAAVLVVGWSVVPVSLEAAEFDPRDVSFPSLRGLVPVAVVPESLELPRFADLADAPDVPDDAPWAAAAVTAAVLLALGVTATRRRLS